LSSDLVKAHFNFERMNKARPVEFFIRAPDTGECFSYVAARAAIEGNFLIILNECFVESERYNMLSPSFQSLEWLDIQKKYTFSQYSYGEDKKEYEKIVYNSPLYRHLKYPEIDGITYTIRDCCRKCDFHGIQEMSGCDPECPGCPHDEEKVSCSSHGDSCHCPQHPKYEEYIPCPGEVSGGDEVCACPGWAGYVKLEQLQGPCRFYSELVSRGYC
jgi:hypothetical protein